MRHLVAASDICWVFVRIAELKSFVVAKYGILIHILHQYCVVQFVVYTYFGPNKTTCSYCLYSLQYEQYGTLGSSNWNQLCISENFDVKSFLVAKHNLRFLSTFTPIILQCSLQSLLMLDTTKQHVQIVCSFLLKNLIEIKNRYLTLAY